MKKHSQHEHIKVLSLDSFTPAYNDIGADPEETFRRFSTLLVPYKQDAETSISSQAFRRARNTAGEQCALKSPLFVTGDETSSTAQASSNGLKEYRKTQQAMLLEEYRNSLALSHIKGFPAVYGLGQLKNEPVLIREYVEGITLTEAMDYLPHNAARTGITPAVVAALGKCALQALMGARCLKGTFVHRDLSPRNIIIRTNERSLEQQVEDLIFDVCLVDLGSASYRDINMPSATEKYGIWRFGTAEYAPPEMLTRDVEGIQKKRYSETIDTYALCSIMYLLLTFTTPYALMQRISESPYLIKKNEQPNRPGWYDSNAETPVCALLKLILRGIEPKQACRYRLRQMYDALQAWQDMFHPQLGIKSCPPPRKLLSQVDKHVTPPPETIRSICRTLA